MVSSDQEGFRRPSRAGGIRMEFLCSICLLPCDLNRKVCNFTGSCQPNSAAQRNGQTARGLAVEALTGGRVEPGEHAAAIVVEGELLAGDVPRFDAVERRRAVQRPGAEAGAELGLRRGDLAALTRHA